MLLPSHGLMFDSSRRSREMITRTTKPSLSWRTRAALTRTLTDIVSESQLSGCKVYDIHDRGGIRCRIDYSSASNFSYLWDEHTDTPAPQCRLIQPSRPQPRRLHLAEIILGLCGLALRYAGRNVSFRTGQDDAHKAHMWRFESIAV
jgi:hypothetical protein